MIEQSFKVMNRMGLHARPAALLVQTLHRFESQVRLRKDDQEVDAKSIMGILTLTAEYGSTVTISIDGPDERAVLDSLVDFFAHAAEED